MPPCIFCRILANELPSTRVYESDTVVAFLDIQPVNPGHVLVVPKTHAESMNDVDDTVLAEAMRVAKRVGQAFSRTSLACEGYNLYLADGEAAGQEVPHFHLHVFPRFRGDGFGLTFSEKYTSGKPTREELESVADDGKRQSGPELIVLLNLRDYNKETRALGRQSHDHDHRQGSPHPQSCLESPWWLGGGRVPPHAIRNRPAKNPERRRPLRKRPGPFPVLPTPCPHRRSGANRERRRNVSRRRRMGEGLGVDVRAIINPLDSRERPPRKPTIRSKPHDPI